MRGARFHPFDVPVTSLRKQTSEERKRTLEGEREENKLEEVMGEVLGKIFDCRWVGWG